MPTEKYQPALPEQPFLLVSDIDHTLLGDPEGEEALAEFFSAHRRSCVLALVTGRSRASVMALLDAGRLPVPDFIGSSVGTELFDTADPQNRLGEFYRCRAESGFSPESIYDLGEGAGMRRQLFADGQPEHLAGFDWDGTPEALNGLRQRLPESLRARVFESSNRYVDVLPDGMGKGELAVFLGEALRIPRARSVVAGDSGNDRSLFETGLSGILPSNALPELVAHVQAPPHIRSQYPAARGVLDGLCRLGFLQRVEL